MSQKAAHESLNPDARKALGKVSPDLAFSILMDKLQQARDDYPNLWVQMGKNSDFPYQGGMDSLQVKLQALQDRPELLLNPLLETNRWDLSNPAKYPAPPEVARALAEMVMYAAEWVESPPV